MESPDPNDQLHREMAEHTTNERSANTTMATDTASTDQAAAKTVLGLMDASLAAERSGNDKTEEAMLFNPILYHNISTLNPGLREAAFYWTAGRMKRKNVLIHRHV